MMPNSSYTMTSWSMQMGNNGIAQNSFNYLLVLYYPKILNGAPEEFQKEKTKNARSEKVQFAQINNEIFVFHHFAISSMGDVYSLMYETNLSVRHEKSNGYNPHCYCSI